MTTIKETRKNKTECDWDNFKSVYAMRACFDFDDCVGCGAYNPKDKKQRIGEKMITHKELEKRCNEIPQCYCPPEGEMFTTIANTPEWLRRAFGKDKKQGIGEK